MNLDALRELFNQKPYLAWYVKNARNLSPESMVEHILNYGQWDDYLLAEKELGVENIRNIFLSLKSKKRVNLRPQTINYFDNYFNKYAR